MSTGDHLEVVGVVELLGNVLPESVASASRIHSPSCSIVRVRPEQVAHGTFVRNFLNSFERPNVVQSFNTRRKTSVQAEKLVLDHSCKRKVVKQFGEALPDIGVPVFPGTLVIESIDLCNLSRLVISPENGDSVFVADLEGEKQGDSLYRVMA